MAARRRYGVGQRLARAQVVIRLQPNTATQSRAAMITAGGQSHTLTKRPRRRRYTDIAELAAGRTWRMHGSRRPGFKAGIQSPLVSPCATVCDKLPFEACRPVHF